MNNQSWPRLMFTAVLTAILSVVTATAYAPEPGDAPSVSDEPAAGRVIFQVRASSFASGDFSSDLGPAGRTGLVALDEHLADLGVTEVEPAFDPNRTRAGWSTAGLDRIFIAYFPEGLSVDQAADVLASSSQVEFAEPDGRWHAQYVPDDDLYPDQWAHDNTGQAISYNGNPVGTPDCDTDTDQAWDLETGDPNLIVAIIDTGCDLNHPEYSSRIVQGYDFVNNDWDPSDDGNHGTACAGIALAEGDNNEGIAGCAWNVKLMPIKVLDSGGSGYWTDVADGIIFGADNGARILSLSLGGGSSNTVRDAVNYAYGEGCALFCATGNGNDNEIIFPAGYDNAIAVGALSPCCDRKDPSTCDGEYWWGSNYGDGIDFVAPGTRIHTTDRLGGAGYTSGDYVSFFNGTSSATPHAAGIGALVWSKDPSLTNAELWTILQNTCDDIEASGYDLETGYGRLNAYAAVSSVSGDPPGACCFADGHCEVQTEADCNSAGGAWEGAQTDCNPNPCPQPPGACCHPDGACSYVTEAECAQAGGTWQGYGTDCDPNECPQPDGACCHPDGACTYVTDAACTAAGGNWQGYGTDCDPNPCPQPEGACCFDDGTCTYVTDVVCTQAGGAWQGFGTDCNPNPCPQPDGACCFQDGTCTYVTDVDCNAAGGTWQGYDTDCNPNPCDQPSAACCFANGSCTLVTEAVCMQAGGVWQGFGTDCDPNECPQPEAACCHADGSCTFVTDAECTVAGGAWQGYGTDCDPNPCQQPSGACCYEDGHCDFVLETECPTGVWTIFQTCDPNPCPQPEAACCFGDESCQVLTEADCELAGGTWEVEEEGCDPNPCIFSSVDDDGPLPTTYALYRGAPNPFRVNTIIRYDLPEQANVRLHIYDISGHVVRTLSNGVVQGPGRFQITWDGNDDLGQPVGSGVYFVGFEAGKKQDARSVILLR